MLCNVDHLGLSVTLRRWWVLRGVCVCESGLCTSLFPNGGKTDSEGEGGEGKAM